MKDACRTRQQALDADDMTTHLGLDKAEDLW